MDNQYYTTEHKKGQHLTSEERHEIEVRSIPKVNSTVEIAVEVTMGRKMW